MHIVFNAKLTNLGDTGGCLSIIESASVLRSMGHNVQIVAGENRMKYDRPETIEHIPPCDLCIGISVLDIETTRHAKARKKVYWCRGPEWKWMASKHKTIKRLKRFLSDGGKVLCNAEWLTKKMWKYGITAKTCYVGFDFNFYQDKSIRKPPMVGTLYSKRPTKRFYEYREKLIPYLNHLGIRHAAMGYTKHLIGDDLVNFYNSCTIWFAPSKMEGFHRVPAEAALCGCLVIATDKEAGGTADWLIHKGSGLRYRSVDDAAKYIRDLKEEDRLQMVENAKRILAEKIGSKERCMRKLIEAIYDN